MYHSANKRSNRSGLEGRWQYATNLTLVLLVAGSLLPFGRAEGQQSGVINSTGGVQNTQGRQLSLADQLRVGLKVKTSTDKKLVAAVVKAVDVGRLPRSLVDSTFLWARERAKRKSKDRELRPIVYFQPALLFRAKKLGIKLPVIEKIPSVATTHDR